MHTQQQHEETNQLPGPSPHLLDAMRAQPRIFALKIFPHHCRLPFNSVHNLLFAWHHEMGIDALPKRRGRRYVLAAPRGSAKSTIASFILPIHDLLYSRERYIIILSATDRQARQRLRAIRMTLHAENLLYWDNPTPNECKRFTAHSINFRDTQIDAYGAGSEIRGILANGYRPTKIILDDAEASRSSASPNARARLADWFAEIVEYIGDVYTNILAVGTILHQNGLIANMLRRPDFTGHTARSIISYSHRDDLWDQWRNRLLDLDDPQRRDNARNFFLQKRDEMEQGTDVLWPEKEDYEELMTQLTIQGRRAFQQEKQNTPLGPEDALFAPERALRAIVRDGQLHIEAPGPAGPTVIRTSTNIRDNARRFGYLDAALGKGRNLAKGDFAALATVLLLPDGSIVLDTLWARRIPPTAQVARLYDAHLAHPFEAIAIEGTGFQELLLHPIEEERNRRALQPLPIQIVTPKRSKAARIAALEPLLANGTLILAPSLDEEFWEELANWPRTRHDDALDAAAGAVEIARNRDRNHTTNPIPWQSLNPRTKPRRGAF